ncbi:hypothetical protein Tco_0317196 [Tanacetum coccineum]
MAEASSQKTSSPKITPKEEPVTLDKPENPNPFLHVSQVDFTFDDITFTTNNEVALLYPSHPNQDYFEVVSDFISKCCLKEAFTRALNQYKEYLSEVWYTAKTLDDSKSTSGHDALADSTAEVDPGISALKDSISSKSGVNEESRAYDISLKVKLKDLSDILKDTRSAFFTPDSPPDELIIVSDKSEGEEEVAKDKDTEATSQDVPKDTSVPSPPSPKSTQIQELMAQVHLLQSQKEDLEQAKAKAKEEVASMKAKPSYSDIHQLSKLLVTSLKPKLSKLLDSHDFASFLPPELKELPSKITGLSEEIKELKKHVRDMEIELPMDLKEIPTKLEIFTSTISSLLSQVAELKNIQWELPAEFINLPSQVSSVQEKLKTLDSVSSLLHKVTNTLNRFSTMVENALGATSMNVPSVGKATASPAEGETNTKDAETNLQKQLIDLLGIEVVEQYHNKKLLFDKYCDMMLERRKSSMIINCDVLTQRGHISLKVYREDGLSEVIKNLKVNDLHLAEWIKVVQACPGRREKG